MLEPRLLLALRTLAEPANEIAGICDKDITEFSGVWHGIVDNIHALETTDCLDKEDVKEVLGSIRWLFGYRPGSFMEAYIARSDHDEQSRQNSHLDDLKKRVGQAAAELRSLLEIDPRSY